MQSSKQSNQRVRVQSSDTFVGTGVHAPSIVRAAPSKGAQNAFALSQALGLTANIAGDVIQRRHDKAVLNGTEAVLEGRDISDDEKANDSFMRGFNSAKTDRDIADFSQQINDSYLDARQAPDFDPDAWFEDQARQQFEGLDPEVDLDQETIAKLAPALNRLRASVNATEAKTVREEALNATADNIMTTADGIVTANGSLSAADWQKFNDDAMAMGQGPDYVDQIAVAIATQRAAAGDVESLEALGKTYQRGNTFRNKAGFAGRYEQLLNKARGIQQGNLESANVAAIGVARSQLTQLAEAGDDNAPDLIIAATAPNEAGIVVLDTPEKVAALMNKWYDSRESAQLGSQHQNIYASGNGGRVLTNAENNEAATRLASDTYDKAIADGAEPEQATEVAQAVSIERAIANDFMPTLLKSNLEVNPKNPEAFKRAAELFNTFEANQPGFAARNMDKFHARQIQTFNRLSQTFGDADLAIEALANTDASRVDSFAAKDLNAARDTVIDSLEDIIDNNDGTIFDFSTKLKQTAGNKKIIAEEIAYQLGFGVDVETATKNAVASLSPLSGRYIVVDGHMYDNNAGWGSDPSAVAQSVRDTFAAENGIDPDDVGIEPVPNQPGRVRIRDNGYTLPGSVTVESISKLSKRFADSQTPTEVEDRNVKATASQEATRAKATTAAMERLFPIPTSISRRDPNFKRLLDMRQKRWDLLSEAEKARQIARSTS